MIADRLKGMLPGRGEASREGRTPNGGSHPTPALQIFLPEMNYKPKKSPENGAFFELQFTQQITV
jgi:hypothetical protein